MVTTQTHEYRSTILIVDNQPSIAGMIGQLVSLGGYRLIQANLIEQAAVLVRSELPDLILVRSEIPGASSLDFCRELKSNPLTELIPIIMLTQSADTSARVEAIEARVDDFQSLPIRGDEFISRIKLQLIRGEVVKRRLLSRDHGNSEFDAFISHASEDKVEFVRPLADRLTESGIRIWYDEHELQVGDNLREAIERGLAHSAYGIVIFSHQFFAKRWPKRELDGLLTMEKNERKVILPVRFKLTQDEMEKYAPMLADRIAARSEDGMDAVVQRLMKVIRPDLPSQNKPANAKSDKTNKKKKAKEQGPERIPHTDQLLREHHLLLLQPADSSPDETWQLIDWQTMKPAGKSRVRKYVQGWIADPGFPSYEVIERIAADAGCPVKLASQDPMGEEFAE